MDSGVHDNVGYGPPAYLRGDGLGRPDGSGVGVGGNVISVPNFDFV